MCSLWQNYIGLLGLFNYMYILYLVYLIINVRGLFNYGLGLYDLYSLGQTFNNVCFVAGIVWWPCLYRDQPGSSRDGPGTAIQLMLFLRSKYCSLIHPYTGLNLNPIRPPLTGSPRNNALKTHGNSGLLNRDACMAGEAVRRSSHCSTSPSLINPSSAGSVYIRQNLTSKDVRF